MTLNMTLLAVALTFSSVTWANNKCSWVGSDDGCRDKMTGSICSKDGTAGVCATSYWDHCECARVAPDPAWRQKKVLRRLKRMPVPPMPRWPEVGGFEEDAPEKVACAWVGSAESCRDKPVGTYCSRQGKAGICAITHWSQCECAALAQ